MIKVFVSLTVISVEYYCKVNPLGLNIWKWLTIEKIVYHFFLEK